MFAAQPALDFRAGLVLSNRYRLLAPIGEGGMASVWEAVDTSNGELRAIKFLATELVSSNEAQARFEREVQVVMRINCPFVVKVHDWGLAQGNHPYMVLDRLNGQDLDHKLAKEPFLPLVEVQTIIRQVCGALATAHLAGVVHRDIKPPNIFLAEEGDDRSVRVLDFGIARIQGDEAQSRKLTRPDEILGTLEYISPEQLLGQGNVDGRADLYGLGVVAYRCLTGKVPFPGDSLGEILLSITRDNPDLPSSIRPELPKAVDDWTKKALCQDRKNRFQNAQEMAEALCAIVCSDTVDEKRNISAIVPKSSTQSPSEVAQPSRSEPQSNDIVLPTKLELTLQKQSSRILIAAPWLEPLLRPQGRSGQEIYQEILKQAGLKESFEDHRPAWIVVGILLSVIAFVILLIIIL